MPLILILPDKMGTGSETVWHSSEALKGWWAAANKYTWAETEREL